MNYESTNEFPLKRLQAETAAELDPTDHESDPPFDYSNRKRSPWINAKRSRDDIKKANVKKIYDIALQKLTTTKAKGS
jgi:hypothetical protein